MAFVDKYARRIHEETIDQASCIMISNLQIARGECECECACACVCARVRVIPE